MIEDEVVDRDGLLERLGVSHQAESLWRALLATPTADARELSQVTGLSETAVNAALASLSAARLIRPSDSTLGVAPIEPTLAIETHIARLERQQAEQQDLVRALRIQIPELAGLYSRGLAASGTDLGLEVITDLDEVQHQLDQGTETVRTEFRTIYHTSPLSAYRHAKPTVRAMVARGVRVRSIISPNEIDNPDFFAELEAEPADGGLYRALPESPTRLMIFDRELAVIAVDPTDLYLGAIFLRVRQVVDLLILLFDQMWSVADPVFTRSADREAPTGRLARTLELMVLGNTDQRIARTLGVGTRTVRREVSELKLLLGVSSRTEIGAAAIRRGWL